jgi:HEAT repeat protein
MRLRMWAAQASCLAAAVTVIACLAGCDQGAVRRRQLSSDNPLDRTEAIVHAYQARDLRAVHKLVALLDDPSDAVRMYAIQALRRLCGVDYGYRYYASAAQRAAAVERWRQALRGGGLTLRPAAPVNVSNQQEVPATAGAAP